MRFQSGCLPNGRDLFAGTNRTRSNGVGITASCCYSWFMKTNDDSRAEEALTDIVVELQKIADRLDELVLDAVRTAVSQGSTKRSEADKKLTKCRSQILRVIRLLNDADDDLPF